MPVRVGAKVGPYEVLSILGKGGMGEVYRARDTKLKREVAIKTLPHAFRSDAERLARFRREAEVLASLNHPNVAAIYGMEQSDGADCLVLELVEGETLADRLRRGPVAADEALTISKQIAEALEAAQERGIVHRDLKPANVKITPAGIVKVLDFGLAKMFDASGPPTDFSQSPTLSAAHTMGGVILGTAAYMSPEQARGKTVDRRTDIWAFGCLLFELLTGRQAFGGETITDIIGAIVKADPDWKALPDDASRAVPLLRRCLQKDVNKRLQHIGDARIELEEAIGAAPEAQDRTPGSARTFWPLAGWITAGAAVAVALWSLARSPSPPPSAPATIERLTITVPEDRPVALTRHALLGVARPSIAISPDGRTLVYVADAGAHSQLYLRHMDSFETKPIPKTEGGRDPFFSPDGRWIGFFTEDKLKKVAIDGGEPIVLADARLSWGGSWSPDNTIVYSDSEGTQLRRISANGGLAERIASLNYSQSPDVLRDGKAALLTVSADGGGGRQIVAVLLDTGAQKVLIDGGSSARYLETGHMIFMRGSSLMAVAFDPATLTTKGAPELILEGIRNERSGGQYTVSSTGTLVYVSGGDTGAGTFGWVDRRGAFEPLKLPVQIYDGPFKISHDGRRFAFGVFNPISDIWIYDFDRESSTRLTTSGKNWWPAWTVDDKLIAYNSGRSESSPILSKPADGTGLEERLLTTGVFLLPDAWSPDGKYLAFTEKRDRTGSDVSILPINADRKPQPFLNSESAEWGPSFSPDGRYIAYISDEDGKYQIYVQPFPDKGKKWQISTDGGEEPIWSRDGRELFYRYGQKWMVSEIQLTPEFRAARPHLLFEGPYMNVAGLSYDVAPDGKRFLVIKPSDLTETTTELNVVLNWFDELQRRVPSQNARPTQ